MKLNAVSWITKLLAPEIDRAQRREGGRFAAYYWSDSSLREDQVKDISATGVYILTKERWAPGTEIWVTLQNAGPLERSRERRITTKARVVRSGDDGIGLTFVPPADPIAREWDSLVESLVQQAKLGDMEGLVRMVEALAFLNRICSGALEVTEFVRGRLSSHKLLNAVEIALKGQRMLASSAPGADLHANPDIVVRILDNGSATEEMWLRDLWTGLLVTSCSADGRDNSNEGYVELFSQLTTIPLRILTVACKAARVRSEAGMITAEMLTCRMDELTSITGAREIQLGREIERLTGLGLIDGGNTDSFSSKVINITPTRLALQLFARCSGHRGAPTEFYAVKVHDKPVPA
jgi:PilZ domain